MCKRKLEKQTEWTLLGPRPYATYAEHYPRTLTVQPTYFLLLFELALWQMNNNTRPQAWQRTPKPLFLSHNLSNQPKNRERETEKQNEWEKWQGWAKTLLFRLVVHQGGLCKTRDIFHTYVQNHTFKYSRREVSEHSKVTHTSIAKTVHPTSKPACSFQNMSAVH